MATNQTKSALDRAINVYNSFEKNPKALETMHEFDGLRVKSLTAQIERIELIQDLGDKHYQWNQLYRQIKQSAGYFVGEDQNKGRFDDMSADDQVEMYTMLGMKAMDNIIDPTKRLRER